MKTFHQFNESQRLIKATIIPHEERIGGKDKLRWQVRIEGLGTPYTIENQFDTGGGAEQHVYKLAKNLNALVDIKFEKLKR